MIHPKGCSIPGQPFLAFTAEFKSTVFRRCPASANYLYLFCKNRVYQVDWY